MNGYLYQIKCDKFLFFFFFVTWFVMSFDKCKFDMQLFKADNDWHQPHSVNTIYISNWPIHFQSTIRLFVPFEIRSEKRKESFKYENFTFSVSAFCSIKIKYILIPDVVVFCQDFRFLLFRISFFVLFSERNKSNDFIDRTYVSSSSTDWMRIILL